MKKPILVVMAAGIGSRFGGLKQMTPFGLHGESLIDYSLYDALRAGFSRVIFIVNQKIKDDFHQMVGRHVEEKMEVRYVMQELTALPKGFSLPEGRVKPWGTAHAILCCQPYIDAPFCAINGDDFYGQHAFEQIFNFLNSKPQSDEYAMVGFEIQNTLSESGSVSRGECFVNAQSYLENVIERTHIIKTMDGPLYTLDGINYTRMPGDSIVSMNMWGFSPEFVGEIEHRFIRFLESTIETNPLKSEYYLPTVVGELLTEKKISVKVLTSKDRWFGVTNASDRPMVENALAELTKDGVYPDGLWL